MKTIPPILTAALLATPALAAECQKAESPFDADFAHCTVRINGHTVTDGDCAIQVAHDERLYKIIDMRSGTRAEVRMIPTTSGSPRYGFWNRSSFGRVQPVELKADDSPWCFRNHRFQMCIAPPYQTCDHGPQE